MSYSWHPYTERASYYREGGLHPVDIGDTFNDRYKVHNKLGFGACSTIWLVEDLTLNRFASLKVIAADVSAVSSELYVARHLKLQQEKPGSHPGKEHVIQIYDTFIIEGPNGTHHCIVAEILGITLAEDVTEIYGDDNNHFPPNITKKVAGQVALGVAYLHKCGIVHGDLHLKNVLFYSPTLQNASLEQLTELFGEPDLQPITYSTGRSRVPPSVHLPSEVVIERYRLPLIELCLLSPERIHVKLCDFGEASIYKLQPRLEKPFKSRMPRVFAAPEIIFRDITSPAPPMDIWALGVLLYMILHDKSAIFNSEYGHEEDVIHWMAQLLGKLPDRWWTRWTARSEYFDDNDVHRHGDTEYLRKNIGRLRIGEYFCAEEVSAFDSLLSQIFRYEPEERIDAEEVVRLIPPGWKRRMGELSESTRGCNGSDIGNN
ncbi:kinase-like domain-containing protein [Cyathus striatus]|nr:kinase-like domain-containing protein [Cyathus striatus]